MIAYLAENLWLFWLVLATACLTLELASGDFYITCFGIGALCSTLSVFVGIPFWAQVLVFAVLSVLSVRLLRPWLVAMLNAKGHHRVSNTDALMGRIGTVSETIKAGDYGRVKIDGDDWKACSHDAADIAVGDKVRVVGRESIIIEVERV